MMMMVSLASSSFLPCFKSNVLMMIRAPAIDSSFYSRPLPPSKWPLRNTSILRPTSRLNSQSLDSKEDDQQASVQDLRVPEEWLVPSKALQESEWLRVTLHKWLDDEYCPEATNIEISKVAAQSFYESLVGKQADLGEILLKMARDLQSISYQESFHGAFSSANAAVHLIASRMGQE